MKIDFNGMKFKTGMYLMLFSLIFLVVLGLLQFAFLETFQVNINKFQTKKMGEEVVELYPGEEFDQAIQEYAFQNNLRIILLNENGIIIMNSDGFSTGLGPNGMGFPEQELGSLQEHLIESGKNSVVYSSEGSDGEIAQNIFAAKLDDGSGAANYLYMSSPIPPVDTTLSALQTQFLIIILILFLLSLIMARLISRKMSAPIVKLTKSAEKLAQGDLNMDIYNDGYTEIRKLSSTLHYATNELSKIENYRKEFIANVSHDLKTPLTVIKVYGEMILEVSGEHPEKRGEHCRIIVKETDRLAEMVNEILELSKLQSDNVKLTKSQVDLRACLQEVLDSFHVLAERDGYQFDLRVDDAVTACGNEQHLKRVFYNLISNAINYTGDDKQIRIVLENRGDHARFEVTDTGKGIPPEKLNSIWERYYKSDENHKRAVIGTGLGLSIVKSALKLHDASYGVVSQEGKGSTFWFELKK